MFIGYARVSTSDQTLDLQKDALTKAGCEEIFSDVASGAKTDRAELEKAITHMRRGDTLVVWKLDRLGRSLRHLIDTVTRIKEKGCSFISITEGISTVTAGGELVFHIFGALAQFERELIKERTNAGLQAARARGKLGGRPKNTDFSKIFIAQQLHKDNKNSIDSICKTLKISRPTLYRYLKQDTLR